jgi:hypothetical protein
LLAGIAFHNDHWNIDIIPPHRRALDFTEPGSHVKIAGIEGGLKPNRALLLPTSQGDGVPQDRRADALKNIRWIDVNSNHRPRARLTKTNNAAASLRHEERASLNRAEISDRGPIPKPSLDDIRPIVTRTQCADGHGVQLMKAVGIFWPRWPDHYTGRSHSSGLTRLTPR